MIMVAPAGREAAVGAALGLGRAASSTTGLGRKAAAGQATAIVPRTWGPSELGPWSRVCGSANSGQMCDHIQDLSRETRVAYLFQVVPPERLAAAEREALWGGPTRTPLLDRLTPTWRRRGVVLIAFLFGVIGGGGAAWWWNDRPSKEVREASPPTAAGIDVRLVLSGVVRSTRPNDRNSAVGGGPLRIDGALLHSRGDGTATVTRIHRPGGSLAIRVPALPVGLSVNHSFERIRLQITPRDCGLATQWTPSSQPFTLTWQDEDGDVHVDLGGDHDASMELTLIRYLNAVCGNPATR